MAIDRSKLQRMYKLMADNGYTQDYNTFEKKFTGDSNYANRKAVYDLFTKNGADLGGSYEEFMRKLQKPRATKPQQQPKTALGRAQQSVAQQKWGGYGGAVTPMQNDSELVRGLKNADAAQRLQAPVSYAKPGAVKQMVKQTRERQRVVGQNVEQAGRQYTNRERDRRNAPAFDLGNEDVNNNIVKTRGQLEDDIEKSAAKFVNDEFGNYIGEVFKKEEDAAFERGQNAAENIIAASPTSAVFSATRARNEEMSPEKRLANITKEVENNIQTLFSSPNVAKRINTESAKLGITPEAYVQNTLIPNLMNKVASDFDKTELKNLLPKGATETILMHAQNSMNGALASIGLMTRGQRQYGQRALAETLEGNNPDYKPGLGTRVAGSTYSFMMDSTPIGLMGKAGAAVAGKVFGNGVAQMARVANSSLSGRIARMVGSGMVSQGVTGVLYGSTNAAVQNYSTGDDTSIGNTVKLMTMGGLSEGASWATMGGIGGAVGAGIYNVSGVKRIPAKVFQLAMEGVGMHMGGNVAKMIEGHDTDWLSVEGNLEACANVVALKLTHARLPKRYAKDGKKESYLDMVKRNLANLMTSDGQRAAFGGYTFTNEEKEQLFGSASAPKRKESVYGYDVHDNPLTRKESLTSWAMRAKKTAAKGKGEESYKDTDAEFVKTAYDEIMADNSIPWNTKAKFSALVMGTVPSARPMMEYIRIEDGSVNEYSKNGELLSKNSFKTSDERDSILYSLNQKREDQRLNNAYGAAQIKDEKAAQETLETVAKTFGLTAEEMKAVMGKDPLKRSEGEQNACVALRKAYEGEQFPEGTLHPEQSQTDGKDVVEENNLGTENPNNEAVAEVLNNMNNAEKAFNAALESNDELKQEYERLTKEGLSEPQIYMELFNSGLTQEELAPFADYINAKAKTSGMYRGTEQKIAETVQKHVDQWSYKDELNGEKQDGGQMVFVKDNKGRLLIVGAGDVAFDNDGRARESVGDMLSVLDSATMEMDFVSKKDVQLDHVEKTEDYAKNYQTMLEELNSEAYAESEKQKQVENAAGDIAPKGEKPKTPTNTTGGAPEILPKGRKQVLNNLEMLDKESSPKDKLGRIYRIMLNVENGEKGAITPEEQSHVDEVLAELKKQGYEISNDVAVGTEYIEGTNTMLANYAELIEPGDARHDKLEDGQTVVGRIITPMILKDGELYKPAEVAVFFREDTSVSKALYDAKKELAGLLRADSSNEIIQRKIVEAKSKIAELEKKKAEELASKPQQEPIKETEKKPVPTFADGSPVPMKKDSKGRETADYSQMTPEQGVEWIKTRFGENADSFVDGRIKRAEKAVKDAEKTKVDMTGEEEDVAEALAARKAAIENAEKELSYFTMVKNVMKQTETKEKAGGEGATGNRYEQWRKDGYHIGEGGVRYDRQKKEDMKGVYGREVKVDFTPTVSVNGRAKVVEVDSLQASHVNGQVNPMHFGPDWQPKDRTDDASKAGQDQALTNFDPEKITGDGNAFIGSAPSVNERHEGIQGNNRIEILRRLYDEQPEKAAQYKQWLIDHAEEFGYDPAEIAKMKRPVLVNELPVDDAKALELGQYRASDFESGGKEIPRASVVINRLGDKMQSVANIMLSQGTLPDDAKMSDLVAQNASKVLDYLVKEGVVSATEEQTLRKDATAMRQWMEELLKTGLFEGDKMVEADFSRLPDNARRAVLATYLRDAKSGDDAKIKRSLQRSFEAYSRMMDNPAFANAKNVEEARAAVAAEIEKGNNSLFGEEPVRELFSNFELELAALYKGLKDQKTLTGLLNKYFDAVQGDKATGKQLEIGEEPREAISKDEAIKEVFGLHESKPAETQNQVDKAVKNIATEITKKTGIEVVTDEKEAEEVIRESEETDSDLKYHKETDEATLEELENGETVKVYRAMQVIDGKLYPPMAAAVNGKRVEANELGVWIRADENPDLAIPDIDPKTKEQKVDKKTGELKWKFKLDKGGKDATGKKATDIPAAYNPYWHTSRSPLNDQFKSAWIRPNIVVVECEVPVSELSSGYKAERAKDAVGEVDWKSGVVSGEVYKQTGRARKVILSRWCKPVRVLSDAEVAQRAKEFVGDAKVEIPENVLTPRQRIEFEKAGFKIGAPEKGVKKSDQINEALKRGLQIDNSVKEFRTKDGEVYGFTDGKKIYLDTKKMKPETPLHEYTHLWCDMLRRVNPKEWENVKKLFDKVEGLKEEVKKLYPELEGDALYEEMITTYSGREGTKKLEDVVRKLAAEEGKSVTESAKAKGFLEKVKEALTKYWKGVADVLGIHFTTAEEVADKVLADWAKGVDPRGSEEGKEKSEKSDTKPSEASLSLTEPAKPKGEEPSKTNPLAWLAHTAEMFKDEQIQKAREELTAAKESGDASDIKRATEKMKGLMNSNLKDKGIGLVERRRIIGREIGKILGEEAGKAEAEKIDKPWKDMDGEERMATAEKNPLTEEEIRNNTSEENKSLIEDAVDYVNGNHGIVQQIAYLKIYDDVRNRHENAPDNSGAEDRTQLAAADNGGSQELGVGTGRESGGPSERLGDGTGGEGRPEQLQPGSKNSAGQPDVPTGEGSHSQGEGETSGLGGVPAGDTQRERSGGNGGNGATVRHESGRGSGNKPAAKNGGRKPAAKQGTHFPDNGSLEQKKQNTAAKKAVLKDALKNWAKLGRGELGINLAGLNSRQIEYLPEVMKAVKDYGVALIDEGIFRVKDWIKNIREAIGEDMKGMKFSDKDIDDFIEEMWNSKYTMNGETHTIGEWAGIYGREKLRKELADPLTEKAQRQIDVENVPVKIGDKKNIEETLPFLLPQQQEDVLRAETQFFSNEHADREHAYGKGYMFTNGTGTGKTYTGLGIAKRLVKQGKGRILIVTPSQKKVSDWIKDGRNLNMEIRDLDDWAKERGTTATTESGEGVVITTFANFGVNKKLLETKWDAVIYDESHRIMENKKGADTARSMQHYMVTNRDERHCFLRLQETNKDHQKMKSLGEQFDAERYKEVKRIQDEYKASHPSATPRDVAYATSRMLPKERNGFTPGDYASFPKLGKIHGEFVKALSHYTNEVKPKLEAQAKAEWKDTKTIFLSATPFNTRENLDYVEGYIFKYPEVEKGGRISGRTQFYLDNFGSAYKFRYNRLEQSTSNPEAVAKQEIAFSDYLQDTLGTMSGRIIDSPYDYSRDFPTVSPDHAEQFNQAVQDAVRGHGVLADAYRRTIGDYNYGSALFETMKVANIIERIKAHLDAGRKVVIFHRRVETKEPLKPPFALMLEQANHLVSIMSEGKDKKEAAQAVRDFRKMYADLLKWEQTLDYSMPREQIAKVFGKDNVLFFSGKESSKVKDKAVDIFNDDNSGKNIIVIQEASGKEGISLHDKTGEHQRVCITLALPQSPITALQIEGRTYRIGNKSNAIFEYPILGLNSEMMLFGEKFNNQVSTTENLALGSKARSLRDSFAKGILEHSGIVPIEQQGVGGKEFDAPNEQNTDPYDDAVLDYYSNQKLNSRNREGVDYFPTPEPLGYKMVEWANMGEGDTAMEPSAGHGAIARYVPKGNQMTAIEPSQSLFTKLQLKAGGLGRKFVNTIFENYDLKNKHDVVVMNPPFGTAGATAIAHLGKAFKHLEEGGRVVALIPRGSTDKKFDKWIEGEKTAVLRAEVELPDIVFEQAGTKVVCRVVVVDKISNEAMRAKAGHPEKWNLGEHYDKIEDFFEDLRDVKMPDRIIDTNAIMMKKSKQTVKDLKELKGVKVDFSKGGISVNVRGDWNDYSVPFWGDGYTAEQKKKYTASTYETLEQQERQTGNETSQAVIAELKKLTCKLAGMTEEEMQRYLKKKYEGKGVMYRVEHAAEVYNKAKGGSKGQRYGRVVPEDVDKKTSEGIEKKFDEEIGDIEKRISESQRKLFDEQVANNFEDFSKMSRNEILNDLYGKELDVRRLERGGEAGDTGDYLSNERIRYECAKAAARRELEYRDVRRRAIEDTYGLRPGTSLTFEDIERTFRRNNREAEKEQLFEQAVSVVKKLGIDFGVGDEGPNGSSGVATTDREIALFVDGLTKTATRHKDDISNTILHEMLHQATMGAIHLVNSGKAEGVLTQKQIDAVNTIIDIYHKVKDDVKRFEEDTYGLQNEYEFAAQMGNSVQRKALDMFETIKAAFRKKGDSDSRNLWQRFKDAMKTLIFGNSDKSKMDKAIEDIIGDFNENVHEMAMDDVRRNDWSMSTATPKGGVSERIIKTVEKVAKRTGGKVKMVNSVEEIENPKVRKDIENGKQVTGWYDEKTGEVHLYMPNIHDTYTAEKTVWHETVGHKGMRGLLGDKFDSYMRDLWMDLDNPINAELRAYVKEKMNMNHLGFYDAIEEFIAKSAEDGKGEPGFWNYIKNKVTDALHEIGYRVSPNVKDVKYMLWLAKNVQKHGDSPLWKMRAEAVRWKIEHEKTEYTKIEGGELYDNDGKSHDFESMSREEWLEATDGEIHYRTSPSAATALDRYHHALDRHSYMATEAFMDNMLSLKKLMEAIDPSIKKIEDVASSMNPYLMQNITEGKMSDKSKLFEIRYMDPLSKAMSSVLDSFDGKKVEDRIRNFNLYMIRKHGLERNRVLFVRDKIREERKVKSEESNSIDALESAWKGEKYDLRKKLDSGQIDLKEYYRQMDEWIVTNLDKDFKAEEHDYSGMHGLQGIADKKAAYDDAGAIDEVMSQEASMESMKKGSVADFWKKVKAATDYSVNSDYESGLISQITHDGVLGMFDWYVPLRKFDEATAEDVYGYVTEMGDPSNYIGTTLMNAKGRKSLSNVEILAQIGLMGNRAIRNGGQNTIKQAFARFVRNSGEQNLVKETKVWVEKIGTDRNGNDIWEEAYPHIPEGAEADEVAEIVDAFEADMKAKQAKGEAKTLSSGTDIGFKFQRAKDKSQHFVDVKIAGRTHRFVVLGNPRAAQALNGMLENGKASRKWLQTVTRWMAMASTSWSPEFVMRNIVRDAEFASSHVRAKEGGRYAKKWARYYGELNPLNVFYNEGAGRLKSMKMKDFKNGVGFGLYARYREGTLGNSKMERYFKEFMENGGETGFIQLFSMHDMEKSYKSIVEKESAKGAKKVMVNAMEVLKILGKNVESLNEVAENMARFATYCTSRDLGRSAARSAYDAKEVSTNFNRHGSGDEIKSFKNGEMSGWQKTRRNTYGFVAGYLRNYSMFFNAGIQSTNLLFKNIKRAPVGTAVAMTSAPFALALIMAAVNNAIIQNEDDKDRGNVKDPYGELPDYIRRNNWCIYVGKNRFVTIPLAIELRAFYSLGDLAAGYTFAKNVESQRKLAWDAVGCMSQLFPVMDFLNNPNYEKSRKNMAAMTIEGLAPTAIVPLIEWWLNNDWKGAPIRRTGDKTELNPAWQNAYNNVPARLVDLNKWVNAKTNNIAPGNPEMKGDDALDWITDPSMLNHLYSSWSGGMGTFVQRNAGLAVKVMTGKADEIEVGDVPFLRSLFYTPREQSSMARAKAKWYNYKEEMEQTIANNDKLKSKNVPTMKRIENAAALDKFEGSAEQRKVNIIKNAEKRMRHWNTMRKKWADDKKQVDFANHNIEMIMQEAVEELDRIE